LGIIEVNICVEKDWFFGCDVLFIKEAERLVKTMVTQKGYGNGTRQWWCIYAMV